MSEWEEIARFMFYNTLYLMALPVVIIGMIGACSLMVGIAAAPYALIVWLTGRLGKPKGRGK